MVSAAVLLGAYNTRGLQIYLLTFTIMVSAAVLLGAITLVDYRYTYTDLYNNGISCRIIRSI